MKHSPHSLIPDPEFVWLIQNLLGFSNKNHEQKKELDKSRKKE